MGLRLTASVLPPRVSTDLDLIWRISVLSTSLEFSEYSNVEFLKLSRSM